MQTLVGKPERKRLLGSFRRRWEDNYRLDLREREWQYVQWMHLAQVRTSSVLLWRR